MCRFYKFLIILFGLAVAPSATAQTLEETMQVDLIKSNSSFVWGEGYGETHREASQMAIQGLLNNIGMTVDSKYIQTDEENSVNGVIDATSKVTSILNSYSQAAVNNTKTISYRDKKGWFYILRYMSTYELEKMFAQRMDRIEDYVRQAVRAEENGKISDALRFLNWAYVLMQSLQYPSQSKMNLNGENLLLINWIPSKMKEILDDVRVEVVNIDEDDNSVDLLVSFKDKPVVSADFTYWDGNTDSDLNSVKDGMGHIEFAPGHKVQDIMLMFETSYSDASQCDQELAMLIKNIKPLKIPSARKEIGLPGKKLKVEKSARTDFQAQVAAGKKEGVTPLDKKLTKEYDNIISEVLKSVKDKSYAPNSDYFTEEGLDMFNKLLGYGKASILGNPDPGYYPLGERVIARSVPMKFDFKNNRRSFVEDVTFTFSPERKIESIAFGLGSTARKDIFEQGLGAWSDSVKMVIVTFLENYKTAFALKRLDYINSIFDENAYIIVGHKLQPMQKVSGDMDGMSFMPKYEYARKSKEEYMKQLKKCFASNEFVNINFSDNDVQKAAYGGDTFGIQIKQDYYSEHYGDQGYLFLFVDLNDADSPIIKIRTWQPERNPDLTPMLPKSSRDFGIYSNSMLN